MQIVQGVYLAHGVVVTGDVMLAAGVNLWFSTVIRGDVAKITLHENVNIQDGSIVHTDFGAPQVIESGVVAGHRTTLHGVRIGQDTLIGMGATLLSGTEIGPECIIAAGALVVEGAKIPPRSVVMGIPGKVVRSTTIDDVARTRAINARYLELARRYVEGHITQPYGG